MILYTSSKEKFRHSNSPETGLKEKDYPELGSWDRGDMNPQEHSESVGSEEEAVPGPSDIGGGGGIDQFVSLLH